MMKKLTALLLALCMLLAVVPALGEDFSGTWYLVLAEVTAGKFELNADGTATADIPGQEETLTGTWTADDASVTITINDEPLPFAWDGEKLFSDQLPIPVIREAGRVSLDLVQKYMNGEEYELPEGMTDMELLSLAMTFAAEIQTLSGSTDSGETSAEPAAEPAASEAPTVTILGSTFKVTESYSGFRGTYIAKVQNNNDVPLWLTGGNLKVTDDAGNEVGKAEYLYTCGSKYLEPGETSFVSMQADMEENNSQYSYEAAIETKTESYHNSDRAVTVENPVLMKSEGYEGDTMRVTVINDTDAPLAGLNVVFILEDADGNLLQLSTEALYRHELGANSTITMVTSVDSKVAEFCDANGIQPTTVEAFAWVENK